MLSFERARLRECIFDVLGSNNASEMSITANEHQRSESSAISRRETTHLVIPASGLPELLARVRSQSRRLCFIGGAVLFLVSPPRPVAREPDDSIIPNRPQTGCGADLREDI
jgi:hypothetical protein